MNCIMKINIPSNNDIKVGFIKEFLVFPADEEILLTSGTILEIKNIISILTFSMVPLINLEVLN